MLDLSRKRNTPKRNADSLYIILFVYEILKNKHKVLTRAIDAEIRKSSFERPKSQIEKPMGIRGFAINISESLGREAIDDGRVERIDLSKGGAYTLPWYGRQETASLIQDLIRRA